ncbi:MAG: hypothetical protein HYV16_11790 [Gammaproteobacteria bacterium]|nr:hypothetical protein [Gammaproteobacteria bacterium]
MHRNLIIVRRPPAYWHLLQAGAALSFLFFGFWLGFAASPEALPRALAPVVPDPAAAQALAELKDKLAASQRAYDVEKASSQQNARHMAELESDKYRMEKEISLYKSILQPAKGAKPKPGLEIAGFDSSALDKTHYRFRLTLVNNQAKKPARGEVSLQLQGRVDGAAKTLNLADLAGLSGGKTKYQFQQFHYLDGELVLPEAFQAEKVIVTVKPAERGAKKQSKEFPWLGRS